MAASSTRPIPLRTAAPAHEHAWVTGSRHSTSEGVVIYVSCTGCGARRVDLQQHPLSPPVGLSRSLGAASENADAPFSR